MYSLAHFPRLYKSDHGVVRLFFLHIQALFNTVNLAMAWFAIGNFFLTFESTSALCVSSLANRATVIITIVATSFRNPLLIAGGDAATIKCWSGTFLQDDSNKSFDWLGEVKYVVPSPGLY